MNKTDRTDLYLQVAAEIRRAIAEGEAKTGERLPPARDLATVLGVNTNTVLRSLRLLQDEGLIELRRRRGATVAGTPERGAVMFEAPDRNKSDLSDTVSASLVSRPLKSPAASLRS